VASSSFSRKILRARVEPLHIPNALHKVVDNAFGFGIDFGQPPLQPIASTIHFSGKASPFRVIDANIFGHDSGVPHLSFEPRDNRALNGCEIEGSRI
jgi:hypothetical protein